MDKNNHQIAYMGKISGQKMQKTINIFQKNAYIVEKCVKFVQKTMQNAYIAGKSAKKDRFSGQKRIYSRKNGQKGSKNGQKKDAKRIYRENFAHFSAKISSPPASSAIDEAQPEAPPKPKIKLEKGIKSYKKTSQNAIIVQFMAIFATQNAFIDKFMSIWTIYPIPPSPIGEQGDF